MTPPRQYTVEDAAQLLGFDARTVYDWINTGHFPARRFGRGKGTLRVDERDICAYIDSRPFHSAPGAPAPAAQPRRGRVRRVQNTAA